MKLHLPVNLRKVLLACILAVSSAAASDITWDSNWDFWGASETTKAPKDVVECLPGEVALSGRDYDDYWSTSDGGKSYSIAAQFRGDEEDFKEQIEEIKRWFKEDYPDLVEGTPEFEAKLWGEIFGWDEEYSYAEGYVDFDGFGGYVLEKDEIRDWSGITRDVWMHVSLGSYAIFAGGNLDMDTPPFPLVDEYERIPDFIGNTHIQVEETAALTAIIGGNMSAPGNSAFKGNSYLSLNSRFCGLVAGGSMEFTIGDEYMMIDSETDYAFTGNTYISIRNIQTYFDGGWECESDLGEWALPDEYVSYYEESQYIKPFFNQITGGNVTIWPRVNGAFVFSGDSHILIDLKDREGEFGKRVFGGDFAFFMLNRAHHEGDTYVKITNASDVTFIQRVVGGSMNYMYGSMASLHGSTNVEIDSGTFQYLVIGGMCSGIMMPRDYGTAGRAVLDGDSHVKITGGTYEGASYRFDNDIADKTLHGWTLGNVALVGGNYAAGNIETDSASVITGSANTLISGGSFSGHVVGGSVMLGEAEDFTGVQVSVEKASLTMTGGEVTEKTTRVIGGLMLYAAQSAECNPEEDDEYGRGEDWWNDPDTSEMEKAKERVSVAQERGKLWQSRFRDDIAAVLGEEYGFQNKYDESGDKVWDGESLPDLITSDAYTFTPGMSLCSAEVTITGSSQVYDVVGGSWVACEAVANEVVKQGDITVNLGAGATIKGNVYAAGIQAGDVAIETTSTTVNLASGVTFEREDDALTVVSGGYLCADAQDRERYQNAWSSWRANASTVTGKRTLNLTDASGYANLAEVYFTNFDEVNTSAKDVKVGALMLTDTQNGAKSEIILTGGGQLTIVPEIISISGYEMADDGILDEVEILTTNLGATYATGADTTLYLAPSEKVNYTTVQAAGARDGGILVVDLAPADGARRELHVQDSLSISGGTLDLRVHVTNDQAEDAFISKSSRSEGATVAFDNAKLSFTIGSMQGMSTEEAVLIVLVDKVDSENFTLTATTEETLKKWFGEMENVRIWVDELERLVLTADVDKPTQKPKDPRGPHYHEDNALTENGKNGGKVLDEYFFEHNAEESPDRDKVLESVFENNVAGNKVESDRIQAAAAGASIAALGMAMADDMERQLRLMRNRVQSGIVPEADPEKRHTMWVNAEGDHRNLDAKGTDPGYKMNSWGGTLGLSYTTRRNIDLGFAITAMYGDFKSDGPDKLKADTDTCYLSGFARMQKGKWTHTFVATAGLAYLDGERTVNLGSYGSYSTDFDTTGYLLGVMYEVGRSFYMNATHTSYIEPIVNVSWRHVDLNGYTESGSDAALHTGDQTLDTVAVGGGFRIGGEAGRRALNRGVQLQGRALVKAYMGDKQSKVKVGFADRSMCAKVQSREQSTVGVELGGSVALPLHTNTRKVHSLFMDMNAELRGDYTNLNATLGYKAQF